MMVCSIGNREQGYEDTLVVDAKTDGAVVIRSVSEYLARPDKYDMAVKRLEADWFQNNNQVSGYGCCNHICDTAINEVDYKLGSPLIERIDQIVRQLIVIFRFIRRKVRGICTPPSLPWSIRPVQVKAFTCGGFVQWCYYKGVSRMVEEGNIDRSLLRKIIFNPHVVQEPTPFELLTTTPADVARCDTLSWKYVIKDGVIREVSNDADVRLITVPA
jgi:hypothetical protein